MLSQYTFFIRILFHKIRTLHFIMSFSLPDSLLDALDISLPSTMVVDDVDTVSLLSDLEPVAGNNKLQRAIVTCFPPVCEPKWLLPNTYFPDTSIIQNWCGQFEIATSTEALHFHVYVEFVHKRKPRFNQLRSAFADALGKGCNIVKPKHRMSKKSQACSVNYVLAPDKRAPETESFIWEHNKDKLSFDEALWRERTEKSKSSKEDIKDKQVHYIESKPKHWTWEQIVHESIESKLLLANCSWGSKYHAGRHAEAPRRLIDNVVILYGAGGTGKTTLAQKWDTCNDEDYAERYYKRNYDDGKFWGGGRTGYRAQRIIHLEEFCGQESCSKFKEICDIGKHGPSVNIKNGGVELNHQTVVITSNHHPAGWYRNLCSKDPKQWPPIARRFTSVWFFPEKRPDGTLNIPDSDHLPYYEDQTDQFASFIGDYTAACQHATEHWGIQECDTYDAETSTVYQPGFNPLKRLRIA